MLARAVGISTGAIADAAALALAAATVTTVTASPRGIFVAVVVLEGGGLVLDLVWRCLFPRSFSDPQNEDPTAVVWVTFLTLVAGAAGIVLGVPVADRATAGFDIDAAAW